MVKAHSLKELPANFSQRMLRNQTDNLEKDYLLMEENIATAWNDFVKANSNLPPNLYQLRWGAFKLCPFPTTKCYDLFKTFVLLLVLKKHDVFKFDPSRTYVIKMVKKS